MNELTANATQQNEALEHVATIEQAKKDFAKVISHGQFDWLLKTRHKNGLAESGAVLKVSQKLYINKPIFIGWFLEQKAD